MRGVSFGGKCLGVTLVAMASLLSAKVVIAQDYSGVQTSNELIVYGDIIHGERKGTTNPVLSYDLEYFQRFEPISAGDALKRVPGVSFSSDVLEYDEVQMRGLPSQYTQVQINGQNQTGIGSERVFFVDRIPAELIDGIEIIRSPSADMSSEGIGGTVNAKLKRAGTIKGGWVRGSILGVVDDQIRGAGSLGYGGSVGNVDYLFSLDVQQRRNPKKKFTSVYNIEDDEFEYEKENDTRDGTDYAFNGEIATKVGKGELRVHGFYVFTDRNEFEFVEVRDNDFELDEVKTQKEDIKQHNSSIVAEYKLPIGPNEAYAKLGYRRFVNDLYTVEKEGDDGNSLELDATEKTDTTDQDWFGTLAYTYKATDGVKIKVGFDGSVKTRDHSFKVFDDEGEDDSPANGTYDIEEKRFDPYIKANWKYDKLDLEAGLRYENTWREISGVGFSEDTQFGELNPSLHLKYGVNNNLNFRFSVARTVKRPDFEKLSPAFLSDEPDDDDRTFGNPNLKQETAWGIDTGLEYKFGNKGLIGFNFFNRDIKNVIELVNQGDNGDGGNDYSYQNFDKGRAYGIEVDVSTPLTFVGLENTTIFANYTWLETEVLDPLTGEKRRFRDQPDYVYNIGVIQSVPQWNTKFGVSYNKRGDAFSFDFDEVEKVSYDGNLEAFIEKRFSDSFVVRFTASNLLDAHKVEYKQKYDGDRATGDVEEIEIQDEQSGPLFMITGRKSF